MLSQTVVTVGALVVLSGSFTVQTKTKPTLSWFSNSRGICTDSNVESQVIAVPGGCTNHNTTAASTKQPMNLLWPSWIAVCSNNELNTKIMINHEVCRTNDIYLYTIGSVDVVLRQITTSQAQSQYIIPYVTNVHISTGTRQRHWPREQTLSHALYKSETRQRRLV